MIYAFWKSFIEIAKCAKKAVCLPDPNVPIEKNPIVFGLYASADGGIIPIVIVVF